MTESLLDERGLSKLRWRSRRGLLENDLYIEKFFNRHAGTLTVAQADGMNELMELADNDLLDLNLGRKTLSQVDESLVRDDVQEVLNMLKKTVERASL